MPLETANIIGNLKPVQLDNPLDVQGKVMNLSALRDASAMNQIKLDETRRGQEETRTLNDLYKGAVNPDGTFNRQAILTGAAQRGLGSRLPGIQKSFAESDKATADVDHVKAQTEREQIQTRKAKLDLTSAAISSLLSSPQVTQNDVIGAIAGLVQNKVIDPIAGEQMVQQVNQQTNPANLRNWLIGKGMESMDGSKRMELLLPKTDLKDTGGGYAPVQVDQLTGKVTAGPQVLGKTQTPDSIASNSLGRDRLAFDKQQGSNSFVPVEGVGLFVGNKATGEIRPVTGPDGKPIKPAKNLNQDQSNALLFGSRMREADKIINQLDRIGVASTSLAQQVTGGSGLTGTAATAVATPQQQQVEQAQRDFINATLRRESGASISPGEFDSARKQYFVQAGDSPELIAQKARNRQLATNGMLIAVPAEQRDSLQPAGVAPTAPGIDPNAIAAELARRAAAAKGAK